MMYSYVDYTGWIILTERGCTEKCSTVISDENLINIFLSEAVTKLVTSGMSLLPGTYLIFVIFLHRQNFWRVEFTPKNANFSC